MTPYRDAAHLRGLLEQVFARGYSGENADLIVRHRMAVGFAFSDPELRATVDGRSGALEVRFDPPPGMPEADVSFSMSGATIHRFWMGELNLMAALAGREVSARGNLIRALLLTPTLPLLHAAYRALWIEEARAALEGS